MKISEYTHIASSIKGGDLTDVSGLVSEGVYETRQVDVSLFNRYLSPFDIIIDAAGKGDFATLEEVLGSAVTEDNANKTIFVRRGEYAVTENLVVYNGQKLFFDNPTIDMSGFALNIAASGSSAEGQINIIAEDDATHTPWVVASGGYNDWSKCLLVIKDLTAVKTQMVTFGGINNSLNVVIDNVANNYATPSLIGVSATYSRLQALVKAVTNTYSDAGLIGVSLIGNHNILDIIVQGLIADNPSVGLLVAGATYNTIIGVAQGNDLDVLRADALYANNLTGLTPYGTLAAPQEYTATAGQTDFGIDNFIANSLSQLCVFRDGVLLPQSIGALDTGTQVLTLPAQDEFTRITIQKIS